MQTSLTKDNIASSYDTISPMTLWEMTRLPADDQTFGSGPGPSTMGHARSISSESMSSSSAYGQQNALSRNHPSLNYRTGIDPGLYLSPNSAEQGTSYVTMAMKRDSPPRSHLPSRRRGASPRSDDEDELVDEPLDPNASAQDRQAYKRRRNTLAARRSRQRRQAQFQKLEEDVARLNRERDIWKERALMMERLLSTHGLPCPNFSDR